MTEFVKELKSSLDNILALVKGKIEDLSITVERNLETMQIAYDNIKGAKAELKDISDTVYDFAQNMANNGEDSDKVLYDAEDVIADCFDLVADGYIADPDIDLSGSEETVEDEEETDDSELVKTDDSEEA